MQFTEELKIVMELFAKITDGAVTGAVVYLVLETVKSTLPWIVGWALGYRLIDKIPKFSISRKEEK